MNYEQIPDDVDSKIGQPGYVRRHGPRRPVLAALEHRRRAAALAVPDGAHQPSAPGEDDALLAQPLRDRVHEDRGRARRRRGRALHGGEAHRRRRTAYAGRSKCCATTRSAISRTFSSTSRRTRRCSSGSTAGRTRGPARRKTSAARSWSSSRWASATTPSPTCTRPRASSPGGTCRGRARRPTARSTTSSSTTRTSTTRREDVQLPDLSRRRQDDSGARCGRRACRTASTSSTASRRIPNTARYLARKLYRFFVSEFGDVNETFVEPHRDCLPAEPLRHEDR